MLKLILLATSLLVVSATSQADVYFWRDANGVIQYSDICPTGVNCKVKKGKGVILPQTTTTSTTSSPTTSTSTTSSPTTSTTTTSSPTTSTSTTSTVSASTTTTTTSTSTAPITALGSIKWHPGHYLFGYDTTPNSYILSWLSGSPLYRGIEITYQWKNIETSRDVYNFTTLDSQLAAISGAGKKLIILVGLFSYSGGVNNSPAYLRGSEFGGGVYLTGSYNSYNPVVWNTAVKNRIVLLMQAIAAHVNSNPAVEGVNVFLESAYQPWDSSNPANAGVDTFDATAYKVNMEAIALGARNTATQTMTFMGFNFPTGTDLNYWAASASTNGFGLATGDTIPTATTMTGFSYTYFCPRSGLIPLVPTVDYPDFFNPAIGWPGSTLKQIYDYARNNLCSTHIIWNPGFDATVKSNLDALLNNSSQVPQDVAGGLNTRCPSMFPACMN